VLFPISDDEISSLSRPRKNDLETVIRGVRRRLGLKGSSKGSLLSGENIQNFCAFTLMSTGVFSEKDLEILNSREPLNLFLKSDLLQDFLWAIRNHELQTLKHSLFLHNSDVVHTSDLLLSALNSFKRIYVTNWLGHETNIHAIPIGLENQSYLRNGVQNDYVKLQQKGLLPLSKRPISLLTSFNISTNLIERTRALDAVKDVQGGLNLPNGVPPKNYRRLLANTKYVLSPPGNGPDCHRTWEAIYLGAIPIVKRKYIPSFEFNPPMIIVDDWTEVDQVVRKGILPEVINEGWEADFWKMVTHD
jgi:hypothetical protein